MRKEAIVRALDSLGIAERELRAYGSDLFAKSGRESQISAVADLVARINGIRAAAEALQSDEDTGKPYDSDSDTVYVVDGDTLVKRGKGRDQKSTYEHKCPREAFDLITRLLDSRKGEFDVVSVISESNRPVYHTYIVVGCCVAAGLIEKRTRGSYRVLARPLVPAAAELWQKMSTGRVLRK